MDSTSKLSSETALNRTTTMSKWDRLVFSTTRVGMIANADYLLAQHIQDRGVEKT